MNEIQTLNYVEYDKNRNAVRYHSETIKRGDISETVLFKNGIKMLYEKIQTEIKHYQNYGDFEHRKILIQIRFNKAGNVIKEKTN